MTELSKEEKDAYWKSMKANWALLKKESTATDAEKETAKIAINNAQKALNLEVTKWDEKKQAAYGGEKSLGNVNWETGTVNAEEKERYKNVVATAVSIVKERHPDMDMNGPVFGPIVSAVTGHLISLRS